MWILEAIPEIPVRRPFLVLLTTLGAAFLLLARFFGFNPLYQPVTYAVIALDLYLLDSHHHIWKALLLISGSWMLAYLLLPNYLLLFSIGFALLIGKLIYRELFRVWKFAASAALLFISVLAVAVWQQIGFVNGLIPWQLSPVLHGAVFAFCVLCSVLAFQIRKDPVQEASSSYNWKRSSEVETMVQQTLELYEQLRSQVPTGKVKHELQEFCERLVHLCFRLQEIQAEISRVDITRLLQQIQQLDAKIKSLEDPLARKQYEHAVSNKKTQLRQHETIRNQGERIRAQILNYLSALENMQFAYANQHFSSSNDSSEIIDFFAHMTNNRAENVYETSEAYQKLLSE